MVDAEHSKERVRAEIAALEHESEGYDARIAGAKSEGDKAAEGKFADRKKQVAAQIKELNARLSGKAKDLVEPEADDEETLEG